MTNTTDPTPGTPTGMLRRLRHSIGRSGRQLLAAAGPRTFALKMGTATGGMVLSVATAALCGFDFARWRGGHSLPMVGLLGAILVTSWVLPRFSSGVLRSETAYAAVTRTLGWWFAFQVFWLAASFLP